VVPLDTMGVMQEELYSNTALIVDVEVPYSWVNKCTLYIKRTLFALSTIKYCWLWIANGAPLKVGAYSINPVNGFLIFHPGL
jgi:hypothetical protein